MNTIVIDDKKTLKEISNVVWSDVKKITIEVDKKEIKFLMRDLTCVDMGRTIRVCTDLLPDVERIVTHYLNGCIDMVYYKGNSIWKADRSSKGTYIE